MSRAAGATFPVKELPRDLLPSSAIATRIWFSCGPLSLPEPHRGLIFGNVSRGTWVGATWPARSPVTPLPSAATFGIFFLFFSLAPGEVASPGRRPDRVPGGCMDRAPMVNSPVAITRLAPCNVEAAERDGRGFTEAASSRIACTRACKTRRTKEKEGSRGTQGARERQGGPGLNFFC